MTLPPDIRYMIASYTANMNVRERAIRAAALCRKYGIADENDRHEIAMIAAVNYEEMKKHGI